MEEGDDNGSEDEDLIVQYASPPSPPQIDNSKQSIVCKYFSRKTCRNGDECPYSQENEVIQEKCKTSRGSRGKQSTLKRDVVQSNSQSNGGGGRF